MNVKDLISAKENSASVALHKFILLVNTFPEDLFCFFEGKDSPYFSPRIESDFEGEFHPINCKGKKNVIKLFELIEKKNEYDKYKKAFFIDRDFDQSIKSKYDILYETPCYSIENLYSGLSTFKKILKSEFDLTEVDKEFQDCVALYQARQNEFHDTTLLFNAWYACLKVKALKEGVSTNVNLDNKLPKGFVVIRIEGISQNYDLDKIDETFTNSLAYDKQELQEKIEEFKQVDKRKVFRGKYEIEFVYEIIKALINDANDKKLKKYLKKRTKLNLDKAQIISQLSQYAETPDCLKEFINNLN